MPLRLPPLLKAAADPTRLRLLHLLQHGSLCVCDLQKVLRIPQPTISRHLAALRHAGLVVDTRNGARVNYSLAPATSPGLEALQRLLAQGCAGEEILREDLRLLRRATRSRLRWGAPSETKGSEP